MVWSLLTRRIARRERCRSSRLEGGDGRRWLLFSSRAFSQPPLVDGTVVLVKLSDVCAAEAAVGTVFSRGGRDEVREVSFDVNLDAGSRPLEVAEALKFVCHELVVGRVLQGQAVLKECPDFFWPNAAMSAAAGFGLAGLPAASGSRSAAHRGGIYRYQDALRPLMRRWPRHGNRQGCGGQNAVAAGG